jgi:hypothetical protein
MVALFTGVFSIFGLFFTHVPPLFTKGSVTRALEEEEEEEEEEIHNLNC